MEREHIGRYRVLGRLGQGGMGVVMRAMDEVRQREVAIKLPGATDPKTISRLQRECDVLAQLQHHHIVQVFGSGSDTGLPLYVVMEYVEGMTLEQLLRQEGGSLEPRRALAIAQDVAEALAYAHRPPKRIIHRDIKPANVLIRASDGVVKVTDFGLAAVLGEQAGTTAAGTLAYMAPEQAQGTGADERSDLYALGAMLYEMLTGQRPPELARSRAMPPSAAPGVAALPAAQRERIDRLVLGLLERDPKRRRPRRAAEVAEELRALLEGAPARAGMVGPVAGALPSLPTEDASRPLHEPVSPKVLPRVADKPRRPAIAPRPVVVAPLHGQPVQVVPVVPVVLPTTVGSGKALASLILGIFVLVFSCFMPGFGMIGLVRGLLVWWLVCCVGVPAVIGVVLGHVALWNIRKSARRLSGTGQAIAGLVMGYVGLGLVLLVVLAGSH